MDDIWNNHSELGNLDTNNKFFFHIWGEETSIESLNNCFYIGASTEDKEIVMVHMEAGIKHRW